MSDSKLVSNTPSPKNPYADPTTPALPVGSHLRLPQAKEATDGWVTSAGAFSGGGSAVGMAMLRAGRGQMGQQVRVYDGGQVVSTARVVAPLFYDAAGARMHA